MSAFMVNNRTLTIIAKYMAECANNNRYGRLARRDHIIPLEFPEQMLELLRDNGCYDSKKGVYLAEGIHRLLTEENVKALAVQYGKEQIDAMKGKCVYERMEGNTDIDTRKDSRREWLANLYQVVCCYIYQISEGDYRANPFYVELLAWEIKMAEELAGYVVDEFRPRFPKAGEPYKSWDEF